MSAIVEPYHDDVTLEVADLSVVPEEPPPDTFYTHRPHLLTSAREALRRTDVMYSLAERDIRAAYKQAVLGIGWAVITPLLTLVIFTVLFHHVQSMQLRAPDGTVVPYALVTYTGLWGWGFFGGAIGAGSSALLANKVLMAKTHFPRECFPISQILESAFTSVVAIVPLIALFAVYRYMPTIGSLWTPLYIAVEIPFIVGVVLFSAGVIVQARDLMQVLPILVQFGMFATPVIWQFTKLEHIHVPGIPGYHNFQLVYSLINPLGPVIGGLKGSILLGQAPPWGPLGIAACSSMLYLWLGYSVFKRLEVNFADLC